MAWYKFIIPRKQSWYYTGIIFILVLFLSLAIHRFKFILWLGEIASGYALLLLIGIILPYILISIVLSFKKFNEYGQTVLVAVASWLLIPFPNWFEQRICVDQIGAPCNATTGFNFINGFQIISNGASYYNIGIWYWLISIIVSIGLGIGISKIIRIKKKK